MHHQTALFVQRIWRLILTKSTLKLWEDRLSNPFRKWAHLNSELDRMMREAQAEIPFAHREAEVSPSCEILEEKTKYLLKFEIPGIPKEQVKFRLDGNILTLSVERIEKQTNEKTKLYSEFRYGSFSRSFTLPSTFNENKISASFENGVLTLEVPKSGADDRQQIALH
jgi:HSP20 family protein